jgi:uncharacterized RmlC-like cupin family protein
MAYVVGLKNVQTTMSYEPGLKHTFALTQETCGAKRMCMFKSVIPPATRSRPHYHPGAEICAYVLSGSCKILIRKPGSEDQEYEVGPGMFVYIPMGEIHTFHNVSKKEPLELIAAYSSPEGADIPKVEVE